MIHEFKKTSVAAAVAGALLATSGIAQAAALRDNEVSLAAPDDVMLVSHVICDSANQVNTLVGINTFFPNRDEITTNGDFRAERHTAKPRAGNFTGRLHWRFYNPRSVHVIDGVIPVTDNDFVRFDWCTTVRNSGKQELLDGADKYGYLLFHADSMRFNTAQNILIGVGAGRPNQTLYEGCATSDNGCPINSYTNPAGRVVQGWRDLVFTKADGTTLDFDPSVLVESGRARDQAGNDVRLFNFDQRIWLYGHSYLIQGNWASQAFIPIVTAPVWDTVVRNGYPAIERLVRGVNFTNDTTSTTPVTYQDIVMRYFLDPALSRANSMVFWFNSNQDVVRNAVPIEIFDSEQVYQFSFTDHLRDELNIRTSTPDDPAYPGMLHTETEEGGFEVVNTGLIDFYVGQVNSTVSWLSSGISYNLLYLGAGDNPSQVQTEMATAFADLVGPF